MDPLVIYLIAVNVVAFLAFTLDCWHWSKKDRELISHSVLSLFAVAGGGLGMLGAFLAWDRRVRKANVAWRFMAIIGVIVWALVLLVVYGVVRLDAAALIAPLDLQSLIPLGVYLAVINVATFAVFAVDKWLAEHHRRRIREFVLMAMAFVGGAVGGLAAMRLFRHKIRTWYFSAGLPAMIVLQVGLFAYLRATGVV